MADSSSTNNLGKLYHMGFHINAGTSPENDGVNVWCSKKDYNDHENKVTITIHNNDCTEIKNESKVVGNEYSQQILSLDIKEEEIPRLAKYFAEVSKMLTENYK